MFQDQFPWTNIHELNLDWILKHFKEFLLALDELEGWKTEHQEEYEQLKKFYDDFINGIFPQSVYAKLHEWVVQNSKSIIADIIKSVFFVLENGYLVAYIPDSWSDIIFGTTGLDDFPAGYDFGHLTLTY